MNKLKNYFRKAAQPADTAAMIEYHRYKINQYSNQDYRALGWRDSESQLTRFGVLAQIADLSHCRVLDAGCGHGDLKPYLDRLYPGISYYGMEQMADFLNVAINRYKHLTDTHFIQGDFMTAELPAADYTLVNGSLNYYSSNPDFIHKAIQRLYEGSRLGLAFNLLSRITPNPNLVAYPPDRILAFCQTLSPQVAFRDDYSDEDYTIFMYKEANA